MAKWEYCFQTWWTHHGDFIEWLDSYGQCGWELVQVNEQPSADYNECIFKRKIEDKS